MLASNLHGLLQSPPVRRPASAFVGSVLLDARHPGIEQRHAYGVGRESAGHDGDGDAAPRGREGHRREPRRQGGPGVVHGGPEGRGAIRDLRDGRGVRPQRDLWRRLRDRAGKRNAHRGPIDHRWLGIAHVGRDAPEGIWIGVGDQSLHRIARQRDHRMEGFQPDHHQYREGDRIRGSLPRLLPPHLREEE